MWLQGKWCLYNKYRFLSQWYKIVYALLLYLPCNYMEQEGNNDHYMKQEYFSPIFKQKLQ